MKCKISFISFEVKLILAYNISILLHTQIKIGFLTTLKFQAEKGFLDLKKEHILRFFRSKNFPGFDFLSPCFISIFGRHAHFFFRRIKRGSCLQLEHDLIHPFTHVFGNFILYLFFFHGKMTKKLLSLNWLNSGPQQILKVLSYINLIIYKISQLPRTAQVPITLLIYYSYKQFK